MKLTRTENNYILECSREEYDKARGMGFVWWVIVKDKWATQSPTVAARAIEYAQPELRQELTEIAQQYERNREASRAGSTSFVTPTPKGLALRAFQNAGVEQMSRIIGG